MSTKPYVVQQGSPNLVIVPTGTHYEPPQPKVEQDSDLQIPTLAKHDDQSAFTKKTSLNSSSRSVNNDVLIDVSKVKRPASSWASNFLQSIGGPPTKFTRLYSQVPRLILQRKENTQPTSYKETTVGYSEKNTSRVIPPMIEKETRELKKNTQPGSYKETSVGYSGKIIDLSNTNRKIAPTLDKETREPKINLNLIQHKRKKHAQQSTMTKEASQPNSNLKVYESKTDTSTIQSSKTPKEPSLPKGYKIPIQSRHNKLTIQPVVDITRYQLTTIKDTRQLNTTNSRTPPITLKGHSDAIQRKDNKPVVQEKDVITNKETTQPKRNKSIIDVTINTPETNQEKVQVKKSTEIKRVNDINQCKTIRNPLSNTKKNIDKPKYDDDILPSKSNKEVAHQKLYKEITSQKSGKESTRPNTDKEIHKINNKKETAYSTKLKTKKCNENRKKTDNGQSKHSQEILSKKYKNHTHVNKESKLGETIDESQIRRLKPEKTKEKATEKITKQPLHMESINKNDKIIGKKKPKSINKERLSKSISPIKSVVKKINSDHNTHNIERHYHEESDCQSRVEKTSASDFDHECSLKKHSHRDTDIDLRSKLKRKINEDDEPEDRHGNKKNKFATVPNGDRFVPEENLIISFNTKDNDEDVTEKKTPLKKRKQASGGKKNKKIKLEINIVFAHTETSDDESVKSDNESTEETVDNMDCSFLDDFNVDEIVKSLNECKDSPIQNSSEVHVIVNDANAEDIVSNGDGKIIETETITISKCGASIKTNESKANTLLNIEMSPPEILIKDNLEMELQAIINGNRPYLHEGSNTECHPEIDTVIKSEETVDNRCFTAADSITVMTEPDIIKNTVVEERKVLHENENVQNTYVRISSDCFEVKKSSELFRHSVKEEKVIDKFIEVIERSGSENVTHPDRENTICMDTSQDNTVNNNATYGDFNTELVVDHIGNNSNMIAEHSQNTNTEVHNYIMDKSETITNTCNPIETSTNTLVEAVIIIHDSDSENETDIENKTSMKENSTKTVMGDNESAIDMKSADVIIDNPPSGKSEPLLLLDADSDIKEVISDNNTNQINVIEQNADSESLILTDSKKDSKENDIDADDAVEIDNTETKAGSENLFVDKSVDTNTECGKTSNKNVTGKCGEEKSEIGNTDVSQSNDKNNEVSNDNISSKMSDPNTNTKSAETGTVEPKNIAPKTTPTNTKQQNAKPEVKAQNKDPLSANIANKNMVNKNSGTNTKMPAEVSRNIANNVFVRKLETKLLSFTGRAYKITELTHVGKFSRIYSCKDPRQCDYAVKVLNSFRNVSDGFYLGLQKQEMMIKLQNGVPEHNLNCVRLIRGFSLGGLWCFLLEYYPRNLAEALAENKRSFHIDVVQILSRQLVSAVTILRNNNIIHSDIKPSHILINASNTKLKLCGFDQAFHFDGGKLLPCTGTVNYRAPEIILGHPSDYGIDVWSTALVMFEMATNRKLFPGNFNNDILYKQLCTIGIVPTEMLMHSAYRYKHFKGEWFTKIVGGGGQRVTMDIKRNDKLNNILFQTYAKDWGKKIDRSSKAEDKLKLCAFSKLLYSMLVMHPKYRIAIEFVFANPFIYETFDQF